MIELISAEGFVVSYIALYLLYIGLFMWSLIDIVTTKKGVGWKGLWAMIIIFTQLIGIIIYIFVGRKQGKGAIKLVK